MNALMCCVEYSGVARVVVDKRDHMVRIRGSDPVAVARAREIMEFQVHNLAVAILLSFDAVPCRDGFSPCATIVLADRPRSVEG